MEKLTGLDFNALPSLKEGVELRVLYANGVLWKLTLLQAYWEFPRKTVKLSCRHRSGHIVIIDAEPNRAGGWSGEDEVGLYKVYVVEPEASPEVDFSDCASDDAVSSIADNMAYRKGVLKSPQPPEKPLEAERKGKRAAGVYTGSLGYEEAPPAFDKKSKGILRKYTPTSRRSADAESLSSVRVLLKDTEDFYLIPENQLTLITPANVRLLAPGVAVLIVFPEMGAEDREVEISSVRNQAWENAAVTKVYDNENNCWEIANVDEEGVSGKCYSLIYPKGNAFQIYVAKAKPSIKEEAVDGILITKDNIAQVVEGDIVHIVLKDVAMSWSSRTKVRALGKNAAGVLYLVDASHQPWEITGSGDVSGYQHRVPFCVYRVNS